MANNILFVFEGERTEELIFNSLGKYFFRDSDHTQVFSYWCSDIYDLYREIIKDRDLDLFSLLKEKDVNAEELSDISRDSVSEIYLFFDYDGHATMASDDKVKKMLRVFNEETDAGKLYISYPMCEAFRHLSSSVAFQEVTVLCKENIHYKEVVSKESDKCYQNLNKLGQHHWNRIIGEHCKKLQYLMTGSFSLPLDLVSQYEVFVMQEEKHIKPKNEVAVLSGFPVLIADYYGYSTLPTLIAQDEKLGTIIR